MLSTTRTLQRWWERAPSLPLLSLDSLVIKGEPAAALAYSHPSPPDATHALAACANVCSQVEQGEELVLFCGRQRALSGSRVRLQYYLATPANGLVLW